MRNGGTKSKIKYFQPEGPKWLVEGRATQNSLMLYLFKNNLKIITYE
jgi:hypothetical protein